MKKVLSLSLLLITFILIGCETEKDIQGDIEQIRIERENEKQLKQTVVNEVSNLKKELSNLKKERSRIDTEVKELEIWKKENRAPHYILKVKLKQSHISLSLKKHLKDATNSIKFEIPVSKEYYDQHKKGDRLVSKFRGGSAVLYGSFGSWKVTVVDKRIE